MKMKIGVATVAVAVALAVAGGAMTMGAQGGAGVRPQGPCDIYAAAGDPCVAAHSTTRALYAAYNGPLYQVLRQSDRKTLNIGVVKPTGLDAGGYADAAAQDAFCANTYCWITVLYDQSPKHNDLTQPPRGGFSGPAMGGFDTLPIADMAPITVMGHKAYGVFIAPGMGLRQNDAKGTAVDDQAEGQYWVINGQHYNSGCCFDYGNAETDSRDDGNGTMETTYFGDSTGWYHGNAPGPWVMTDQENNLVGCVNSDRSKLCKDLPNIASRFVTAMAKGEAHHWTSMGGDAQKGALSVMYNGPRIDATYDPMRKQGAILLGNGGDNSNSSQGTFYEGAMTASGTFPTDATDQLVQANVAAARYDVQTVSVAPASATATPPGLQTFSPGSSQETAVTFTNTTGAAVAGVKLSLAAPKGWSVVAATKAVDGPVAPGASVSVPFKVTSGPAALNGDLVGKASWMDGGKKFETAMAEKVRNVSPVKINEFRVGTMSPANPTNSFIELYNAGAGSVDISNWTLTEHPAQQGIFSTVKVPAGTKLAAGGFYVLGLANSGLAVAAHVGDVAIHVRSTTGMTVGDTVGIDTGANGETHTIASLGTAAGNSTPLWQPLPDGPVLTVPVGSTNVPVTSVAGFAVGEAIAIGYGGRYPTVAGSDERYEVATVTAVGKQGTQAFLGADAAAGSTNIKVTSAANISVGDRIRLDIESVGHGIETVTVTRVGSQTSRGALVANASAGATNIRVRSVSGLVVGDTVMVGTSGETVAIKTVGTAGPDGTGVDFAPALARAHAIGDAVVVPGTGLELDAPLKFNHAANMPFSDRGTGISITPATAFVHLSNEPVQPLGTGITLDAPLRKAHAIDAVLRDAKDTVAGFQGTAEPSQWFGGPALSASAGNMVLRDSAALVVDSLNYGLLVDPWADEGYQAVSGTSHSGCRVAAPGAGRSAGRFPDGADTDSNCNDFLVQTGATLGAASSVGTTNIKVGNVSELEAGQTIQIDAGANPETAVIATVGTGGASALVAASGAGTTVLAVGGVDGFAVGETISIDSGANLENVVIVAVTRRGDARITVSPLAHAHAAGAQVSGTGITLSAGLKKAHASGAQIAGSVPPTPGAANQYYRRQR